MPLTILSKYQPNTLVYCLCIQLDLFKPPGFKDSNFFGGRMQVQIDSIEKTPKLFQTMQWNQKEWGAEKGR